MTKLIQRSPLDLTFTDLNYIVKNGKNKGEKTILKGLSGQFLSGHLNALMGPSGAGKSSLMNVLAGYSTNNVTGDILVNGKSRNLSWFRKQLCYIMQEDYLLSYLTVQESMDVATELKLSKEISKADKYCLVQETLKTLNLEEAKNTSVSSLSGGEKKRLCIALELVSNPPILFLDEPTSGLDSQNSFQCIKLLKKLAEEGRTVICTIHQPSARLFEAFDTLYALAEGQCIYRGPVNQLIPFMSSLGLQCPSFHNPADFIMEIATGEHGNFIPKMVESANEKSSMDLNKNTRNRMQIGPSSNGHANSHNKIEHQNGHKPQFIYSPSEDTCIELSSCHHNFLENVDDSKSDYPASYWMQFYVLLLRTFRSIIRDNLLTQLRVGSHIVIGALLSILYYNVGNDAGRSLSNVSFLFFCLLFLVFTAMMPTILTFPIEKNVLIREHMNHWYSLKTYYIAKSVGDLPFQVICPLVYIAIVYFFTNQPLEFFRFTYFTLFCILTSQVAQSIGLAIGAGMNMQQAVFFGATIAIPALLFSGFFVPVAEIPIYLRWLTYLSYIRYGFNGFLIAIYGYDREVMECLQPFCMFKYPKKLMEQLGAQDGNIWFDFTMMIVYSVLVRILGYVILKWKLRRHH